MKSFAVACALVGCALAAPVPEADPSLLLNGGLVGATAYNGLAINGGLALNSGLVGTAYNTVGLAHGAAVATAPVAAVATAPVAAVATAPVAAVAAVPAPAVHTVAHAVTPVIGQRIKAVQTVHAVPTTRLVQSTHHTVHHVPKVDVQKHVTTHTTQHVINHAPVVGGYNAGLVAAVPAVAVADVAAAAVTAA